MIVIVIMLMKRQGSYEKGCRGWRRGGEGGGGVPETPQKNESFYSKRSMCSDAAQSKRWSGTEESRDTRAK